jgi:hypothetical protein
MDAPDHGGTEWRACGGVVAAGARGLGGLSCAHAAQQGGQRAVAELLRRAAATGDHPAATVSHKDELMAAYPFYKTALGRFAPV